jgi:hypothetical protein
MHTVSETIRTLLPNGTRPRPGCAPAWDDAPPHPADVFGVAASLLKRSGAYQYILADPGVSNDGFAMLVDDALRIAIDQSAKEWRNITDPQDVPAAVQTAWNALAASDESLVLVERDPSTVDPARIDWWNKAMELMFVADGAAEGLGFFDDNPTASGWYFPVTREALSLEDTSRQPPPTISLIPTWLNCVLPKSRTSSLGCTLRSLSHHLCLLPAAGVASARWCDLRGSNVKNDDVPLNLLLIPLPYHLPADCFDSGPSRGHTWDSFRFRQKWLEAPMTTSRFVCFVQDLVAGAVSEVRGVDAIVLPEMAIDWMYFSALMQEIARRREPLKDVQFLTTGVRTNDLGETGNFIATAIFYGPPDRTSFSYVVRPKHHRWKLDGRQIRRYALSSYLDPEKTWWENFNISQREIHVIRFRKNSTIATLLCEDLARVDPCQELIRSIGPNLVLVLLMDGPQLRPRWSGRYATVLGRSRFVSLDANLPGFDQPAK